MKITFGGHSCFLIEDGEHKIIIDPFLTGNPQAVWKSEEIDVQFILVTHGHADHLGDTLNIARRTGATVIAPNELALYCRGKGANIHAMHIGGSRQFPFGKVKLTPALHGSAIEEGLIYTGNPCGFLLFMNKKVIYHAGDTGLCSDMKLIGEYTPVDLAILPIGDNFVMGIEDAVEAAKFVKAKQVVPMHYNTFEIIKQDPLAFKQRLNGIAACTILQSGEHVEI
jgi:L-ascorbate metabolism protein UlaG (beta-lactamase superfamily)